MKSVLAVVAVALVTMLMEEKARQLAGDAQQAYGVASTQVRATRDTVSQKVENQPIVAVIVAAVAGFVLSKIVKRL